MSEPGKIKILYGIFAEFIRAEKSGLTTAIGIFGAKVGAVGNPPVQLPNIGFNAYISNPSQEVIKGNVIITLPGGMSLPPFPFEMATGPHFVGHNLNVNYPGVVISQSGLLTATVEIFGHPESTRIFELEIALDPPSAA